MIKVFSGSAHPKFAKKVCEYLNSEVSDMTIKKFKDSEIYVKSNVPVRGDDVFLIQPTCKPTNENLMELLIMIDAMKRSSVKRINCVIPYYGYSRQDRRISAREPITAKLVANLLTKAGANRIITVDLHSPQLVGFFDIDVDHFEAYPLFAKYFKDKNLKDVVAVASDSGFVKKTRKFAKLLSPIKSNENFSLSLITPCVCLNVITIASCFPNFIPKYSSSDFFASSIFFPESMLPSL